MRRRQRRLRSWLRHERMTVAMALAESAHHTSRGQKYARAGVWEHEQNYTAKVRKPPTPQPELFSLEEEPGGGLPAPLSEVAGRQDKVVRHVVEDLGELAPLVQILDLPVPQTVDHVADAIRILDFPIAEQVIEVATISCSPCPSRSPVPEPQSAEQLVEVPTVLTPTRIAVQIAEQIVGIPVPHGFVGKRRLQGFSQYRVQQRRLLWNAFLSGLEQNVEISSGAGLGQGASSSAGLADEDFTGVFRTFPHGKKVRSAGQVRADLPRHVGLWTPAACGQPRGSIEEEKDELLKREEQEELNSLWAVPVERRTHQQMQRITYLPRRKGRRGGRRSFLKLLPLVARALRQQRQWHVAGFPGVSAPRAVLPEAYRKIGLFGRWRVFFFGPWYLEVTCSSFCLRSTGSLISGS